MSTSDDDPSDIEVDRVTGLPAFTVGTRQTASDVPAAFDDYDAELRYLLARASQSPTVRRERQRRGRADDASN